MLPLHSVSVEKPSRLRSSSVRSTESLRINISYKPSHDEAQERSVTDVGQDMDKLVLDTNKYISDFKIDADSSNSTTKDMMVVARNIQPHGQTRPGGTAAEAQINSLIAQPNGAGLLTIPRELRDAIYELALHFPRGVYHVRLLTSDPEVPVFRKACEAATGLLQTCRMIYDEAAPLFYHSNKFALLQSSTFEDVGLHAAFSDLFFGAVRSLELPLSRRDAINVEPAFSLREEDMVLTFHAHVNSWIYQESDEVMRAKYREANPDLKKAWERKIGMLGHMVRYGRLENVAIDLSCCSWGGGPPALNDVMDMVLTELFEGPKGTRKAQADLHMHLRSVMFQDDQDSKNWLGCWKTPGGWSVVVDDTSLLRDIEDL